MCAIFIVFIQDSNSLWSRGANFYFHLALFMAIFTVKRPWGKIILFESCMLWWKFPSFNILFLLVIRQYEFYCEFFRILQWWMPRKIQLWTVIRSSCHKHCQIFSKVSLPRRLRKKIPRRGQLWNCSRSEAAGGDTSTKKIAETRHHLIPETLRQKSSIKQRLCWAKFTATWKNLRVAEKYHRKISQNMRMCICRIFL